MSFRRQRGLSLVELLVAAAILGVLLTVLGSVFALGAQGYRANEASAATQQRAKIAATLLTYEVGLAGYRGVGNDFADNAFTSPTQSLILTRGSGSDQIRTRYYEDRYLQDGIVTRTLRDVTYGVSGGNLVRAEVGRGSWPAISGVSSIAVDTVEVGGTPVALEVTVILDDGYVSDFIIGFRNVDLADIHQVDGPWAARE